MILLIASLLKGVNIQGYEEKQNLVCKYSPIEENLQTQFEDYHSFIQLVRWCFMQGIADTMAYLQKEGRLLRGEHNLLGEAFLVMASAAG